MHTIEKFAAEFENKFALYLTPPLRKFPKQEAKTIAPRFTIRKGKKQYSDWDLKCQALAQLVNEEALKSMEEFVRGFDGFSYVGLVLASSKSLLDCDPKHPDHINNSKRLHLMGFINNEKFAPFVDLHIENISSDLLKRTYCCKVSDQEFADWMMLTYWRKWRNNGNKEHSNFHGLVTNVLPYLRKEDQEAAKEEPIAFFKKYLGNHDYREIISFLEQPQPGHL